MKSIDTDIHSLYMKIYKRTGMCRIMTVKHLRMPVKLAAITLIKMKRYTACLD